MWIIRVSSCSHASLHVPAIGTSQLVAGHGDEISFTDYHRDNGVLHLFYSMICDHETNMTDKSRSNIVEDLSLRSLIYYVICSVLYVYRMAATSPCSIHCDSQW